MKYNKIKHSNNITWINKMRDKEDKKGGGISLIYNKENNVVVNQIETNNSDILAINIENKNNKNMKLIIITIYMSVLNKQEDKKRNQNIQNETEKILIKYSENKILLIGDFNGHIKELGKQKEDYNGKILKSIIDRHNLELLNLNKNCEGEITHGKETNKKVQ